MNDTLQIYEQIEAIKATIGFNSINNDKSEQWIQRQNLQDLYQQAILCDIDFTIDKKLEQDLWNFVFKNQISHFQTQIKDKKNAKRPEAEANLFFFLEAARGFYTKLLQDIVLAYDLELPFCKNFNFLSNHLIGGSVDASCQDENNKTKEKQLMYICQHILTHLGDIARYATMFDQAKSYYLHAIKLVPYLGHPYNQIGILFDTLRTNQLSTVFYYIRSIAVRYTFPLAATNLDKFFNKLIEIPLSRYPSDMTKLTHKDYIQLFLQINALIYTGQLSSKIQGYLELFKTIITSNSSVTTTTFSFEKFDSAYLCQMMSILFFMLNRFQTPSSNYQFTLSLTLLVYLVEQCLQINKQSTINDTNFILPGFYLAFSYMEMFDNVSTDGDDGIFQSNIFKQENSTFWSDIVKLVNSFQINRNQLLIKEEEEDNESLYYNYKDYPLNEERNLESFIPLKDCLKQFNFKKYFNNKNLLSESDEQLLRKIRIVSCFERLIKTNKNFDFFKLNHGNNEDLIEFRLINVDALISTKIAESPSTQLINTSSSTSDTNIRKKRQNVAISSFTAKTVTIPQAQPPLQIPTNNNYNHNQSLFNFNEQQNYHQKSTFQQQQQNLMNKNTLNRNNDLNNLLQNGNKQQQQQHNSFPSFNQNQMNRPTMQNQQQDNFYQRQFPFQQQQPPQQQQHRSPFPAFLPDTTNMSSLYQNNQQFQNKQNPQQQQRNFQPNTVNQQKQFLDTFPSFLENPKTGQFNQQQQTSLLDTNQSVYSKISNIWSNGGYGTNNNTKNESQASNYQPDFSGLNLDFNSNNYLSSNLLWSSLHDTGNNNNNNNQITNSLKSKPFNNNNYSGSMLNNILPQIWSFPGPPGINTDNNNEPS